MTRSGGWPATIGGRQAGMSAATWAGGNGCTALQQPLFDRPEALAQDRPLDYARDKGLAESVNPCGVDPFCCGPVPQVETCGYSREAPSGQESTRNESPQRRADARAPRAALRGCRTVRTSEEQIPRRHHLRLWLLGMTHSEGRGWGGVRYWGQAGMSAAAWAGGNGCTALQQPLFDRPEALAQDRPLDYARDKGLAESVNPCGVDPFCCGPVPQVETCGYSREAPSGQESTRNESPQRRADARAPRAALRGCCTVRTSEEQIPRRHHLRLWLLGMTHSEGRGWGGVRYWGQARGLSLLVCRYVRTGEEQIPRRQKASRDDTVWGVACAIGGRQEGLSLLGTNPRHKRRAVATWGGGWKSECRPWGPALAEGEAWRLFATWLPAIEGDGAQFLRDLCSKGTGQRPVATSAGRNDRQECLPLLGTNPRHKRRAVATWGGDGKASTGLGGLHSLKEKPGDCSLPATTGRRPVATCNRKKPVAERRPSGFRRLAYPGQARDLSLPEPRDCAGRPRLT